MKLAKIGDLVGTVFEYHDGIDCLTTALPKDGIYASITLEDKHEGKVISYNEFSVSSKLPLDTESYKHVILCHEPTTDIFYIEDAPYSPSPYPTNILAGISHLHHAKEKKDWYILKEKGNTHIWFKNPHTHNTLVYKFVEADTNTDRATDKVTKGYILTNKSFSYMPTARKIIPDIA